MNSPPPGLTVGEWCCCLAPVEGLKDAHPAQLRAEIFVLLLGLVLVLSCQAGGAHGRKSGW